MEDLCRFGKLYRRLIENSQSRSRTHWACNTAEKMAEKLRSRHPHSATRSINQRRISGFCLPNSPPFRHRHARFNHRFWAVRTKRPFNAWKGNQVETWHQFGRIKSEWSPERRSVPFVPAPPHHWHHCKLPHSHNIDSSVSRCTHVHRISINGYFSVLESTRNSSCFHFCTVWNLENSDLVETLEWATVGGGNAPVDKHRKKKLRLHASPVWTLWTKLALNNPSSCLGWTEQKVNRDIHRRNIWRTFFKISLL